MALQQVRCVRNRYLIPKKKKWHSDYIHELKSKQLPGHMANTLQTKQRPLAMKKPSDL